MGLKHYLHLPLQKSLMEEIDQYLKGQKEFLGYHYCCIKEDRKLFHVYNLIQYFVSMYINIIVNNNHDFDFENRKFY